MVVAAEKTTTTCAWRFHVMEAVHIGVVQLLNLFNQLPLST